MDDLYRQFVASKQSAVRPCGFDPAPMNPSLWQWQADVVRWACKLGRAALFEDCGLGKTFQQLEWARQVCLQTGGKVLVLAPLAVAGQTVREGAHFGVAAKYARNQGESDGAITVANYERLESFNPAEFAGVVLDECFAAGTHVLLADDAKAGYYRPIESVRVGDRIVNASGIDTVSDIHRREVPYAVRVTVNGHRITCSPNHPFFTQRGWVGAQDLAPRDHALETGAAMRLVRGEFRSEVSSGERSTVLRSILLSEVADASAGDSCESPLTGSGSETWGEEVSVVQVRVAGIVGGVGAHQDTQPDDEPGNTSESLPHIERHAPRSFRAWGERAWFDSAAVDTTGCTRTDLAGGVCFVVGPTDSRLSDELQTRLGASRSQNRHRSGWSIPSESSGNRREEGSEVGFIRVDGVEVLEPGHHDLEQLRSPDGKLYFYDLGGTRHPSFTVGGCLVHNSSILKAYDGKTRTTIIEAFKQTPYRLACTATPSPNDHMELGNHAEFLGVMSRTEMLATFFCHDGGETQQWRLKGHAEAEFWKWVCSWAAMIRRPSDLGYSDEGYTIPPLAMHQDVVRVSNEGARRAGMLFVTDALTLSEQRASRRATINDRVAMADAISKDSTSPWLFWCELNDEQDALEDVFGDRCVSVRGADSAEEKIEKERRWREGEVQIMVSKPSIFSFGMNWQHCADMAFVGVSHSYEELYQAIRRCWRFGQAREVNVHLIHAETDGAIAANLKRKEKQADVMADAMLGHMRSIQEENIHGTARQTLAYSPNAHMTIPEWIATDMTGDCRCL